MVSVILTVLAPLYLGSLVIIVRYFDEMAFKKDLIDQTLLVFLIVYTTLLIGSILS